MRNLKPQQKEQRVCLERFLGKMASLDKFLDNSYKLSYETRKNIEWYCDYRVHQYYQRYLNYLKEEKKKDSSAKTY